MEYSRKVHLLLTIALLAVTVKPFAPKSLLSKSVYRSLTAKDTKHVVYPLVDRSQSALFAQYSDATTAYTSPQSAATIQDLLRFTNMERNRNGLRQLTYSKELEKAAQRHAADMAKNNYFSHDGLNGSDLKDRVALTEYRYTNVGENLFWRTPDNDPGYAVQGWMESPGHRKNMLDEQFTEIGLGYAVDEENGKHYYVQVFGRPLQAPNLEGPGPTLDSMIQTVNGARQGQGLPPLRVSGDLNQGAQEHADEMAEKGELVSKLRRGSYDRFFTQLGARFAARELFNDPIGAVQGWLKKGAQSDLLSERFTETGVGYATDGEQHYYVQLFGSPMETGVGRRDFTSGATTAASTPAAPATSSAPFDVVSGVQPTIKASDATTIVPSRIPRQINVPRRKEKKEDNSRNGDFGRMGFGEFNEVRREDSDEVDNSWNDDKRVIAEMRERRGRVRVSRTSNPQRADQSGRDRRLDGGHNSEEWEDDRRVFERIEEMRYGEIDPSQAKYFGGPNPQPKNGNSKINPNAVGFDDGWNKDYAGTANQIRRTSAMARLRNSRGGPYMDEDDFYYDDRRRGPEGYYDDPRYRRGANGYRNNQSGGRGGAYDYYDDRVPRRGGAGDAWGPRGMRDERRGDYDTGRRGQGDSRMGPDRDRPRRRSNTPGVFGQPNKKNPGEVANNGRLGDIHFRRHEEQQYDSQIRGMSKENGQDVGFLYDPRDGYYDDRSGGGRRRGDYYDDYGYGPRGGRRGGYDDYDMPPRNGRRPPPRYY